MRVQSPAYIAARARLALLLEQTVPTERLSELNRAISQFTAAAVRDDRVARAVATESRAIFDEIFGERGVFERIFGAPGARR